jgi:glutathione S-transferase
VELLSREISPFAARVRVSILAKQLPVRVVDNPDVNAPEFAHHNALRRVPVLVLDDGTALAESDTIVEYLEDAYPHRPLRPVDPVQRARVRLIARVAELYVFPTAVPLFAARASGDAQRIDAQFGALDVTLGQLASFMSDSTQGWHAWGDSLTIADGALAPFLFYVHFLGMACGKAPFANHPRLQRFWSGAQTEPVLGAVIQQIANAMSARQVAKA